MKIDRIQISVAELCQGYEERGTDGIEGIVAYGDCLMSDHRISVNMFMLRKSVMKLFAPSRKAFL